MGEIDMAYNLLRTVLTGEKPEACAAETSRWWSFFRLLQKNRVAALCYEAAAATGAPRAVLMPWLAEHEKAGSWQQMDLFTDYEEAEHKREQEQAALEKERRLQEAMLSIRRKYGKNAILKGTNLQEGATMRDRNNTIGGHKA